MVDPRKSPVKGYELELMLQFIPHRAQQLRHTKWLLEGLPCPEQFRDIQDILFACAGDRNHLSMKEFTRQFQEHVQSVQFGHENICDDQIRRLAAVKLKPLTTIDTLHDLVPFCLKSGTEEDTDSFFVIDDQNCRHRKRHFCSFIERVELAGEPQGYALKTEKCKYVGKLSHMEIAVYSS